MAENEATSLEVQQKKELSEKEEQTVPARYYVPYTDIYETGDDLTLVMEMPGVEKENLEVSIEDDVLKIEGQIDFSNYAQMQPLYTEYNVGHYTRKFQLSDRIDQDKISATMVDGVLTLELPKAEAAKPQKIKIG